MQVNVIAAMLFIVTLGVTAFTVLQQRRAEKLASVRPEQESAA